MTITDNLKKPIPHDGEVLVNVVAATLNPTDQDIAEGLHDEYAPDNPNEPKVLTGFELAGVVEESGCGFEKGDKVYSYIDILDGQKTHQQFTAIKADLLAIMPNILSFDEAASIPYGALTVVAALRDVANLKVDERILIYGATGGLGIFTVQIAQRIPHEPAAKSDARKSPVQK